MIEIIVEELDENPLSTIMAIELEKKKKRDAAKKKKKKDEEMMSTGSDIDMNPTGRPRKKKIKEARGFLY